MNSSSASSSRTRSKTITAGGSARCQCGLPLIIYTAGTRHNSDRRFLRCRNWQLPHNCGFFFWIDDPYEGRDAVQGRDAVEGHAMSYNSEIGNSNSVNVNVVSDLNKKIKKLKMKLEVERFQKKLSCFFTLVAVTVSIWCFCMRKG
ncbi:uncharacterized protein LOC130744074 [Lotus japonicus]|uniref:uncharacterized protein LOC130716228 n=1 Tax=Lotus japonicus TaxID=34305 RepID=UPI00258ACC56|nr:uncharacterized protein LOC130716228 [Lotus japonicus]XP_057426188.1 uncharacterized protein LOC130719588 [Lotus japonicus]XP_057428722.1 uncharacterized protein LOC130722106 [Lotus japonicus]XP_057431101.1 uncharacterized protein LOC130723965 [Lotus japonicus]XP_057444695.1 uncharacterized protein LOC130736938 [Lotus japonicus]XP_057444886.1 uncharacterized protein LOC130737135 [Lotus japonicus]XP_057447009.1 uncharacterized protein LOC130738851 [Lotus japonicus]XP_057450408.1 uncharacte